MIRLAKEGDLSAVAEIYEQIHGEIEAGRATVGWIRGIYPTLQTAGDAYERGELYVLEEDGRILAAAKLNQTQEKEYALVDWLYPAEPREVLVMHTLVVSPRAGSRGLGRTFAAFYEELAKERGCKALRIDTNEKNLRARALYKSLGYREAGVVPCVFNGIPDVPLVCLEKKI